MSLTLDALKKLQEKGQLSPAVKRAPSRDDDAAATENAEAPANVEPEPDDGCADQSTMVFEPQPTMSFDLLELNETPSDTASRQRWTEALANPYGPKSAAESDRSGIDQPLSGPDAQHESDDGRVLESQAAGESESEFGGVDNGDALAEVGDNDLTSEADLADVEAELADSESEVLPVESLAANSAMHVTELQALIDREVIAAEPQDVSVANDESVAADEIATLGESVAEVEAVAHDEAVAGGEPQSESVAQDEAVTQDDSDPDGPSSEYEFPSTPTQPAFLSGLQQPESDLESVEPDEPLIMDTIHFNSDEESPVESAYNPVIQPLDAFEDDEFDEPSDAFPATEDDSQVATAADDLEADANTDRQSDIGHSELQELSSAEPRAEDNTSQPALPETPAAASFLGSLNSESPIDGLVAETDDVNPDATPSAPSLQAAAPPVDEWEAALRNDGSNSEAILNPPADVAASAPNAVADSPEIDQVSQPESQAPAAELLGTLEERLQRDQAAMGTDESSSQLSAAAMAAVASLPAAQSLADIPGAGGMSDPQKNAAASSEEVGVTTATAYENAILEELSNSRGERPFLDCIEQIRRLSDYRFPTNLLLASPSPTTRTGDTLARIAIILSQVDEDLLLVDASDHASLTQGYELQGRLGFVDALGSDIHPQDITCPTSRPKLSIVPFGVQNVSLAITDPHSRQRLEAMLKTWERRYHRVLIDVGLVTSPLLPLLGPLVGDSVLLIPYGKPNEQALHSASTTMERAGTRPIGCLVTDEPIMQRRLAPAT